MNVFAGIAACFHTVKTFSNFEPNYVRLIGPFNANACFAFIKRSHTVFFTTLERSTDVVRQRNGNFFMMKTVSENNTQCITSRLACTIYIVHPTVQYSYYKSPPGYFISPLNKDTSLFHSYQTL